MSSFFCCPKCRGLLAQKSIYLKHTEQCDGNPSTSACQLFACSKALYLTTLASEEAGQAGKNTGSETEENISSRRRHSKRLMNKKSENTKSVEEGPKHVKKENMQHSVLGEASSTKRARLTKSIKRLSSWKRAHALAQDKVPQCVAAAGLAKEASEVLMGSPMQDNQLTKGTAAESFSEVQKPDGDVVNSLLRGRDETELSQPLHHRDIKREGLVSAAPTSTTNEAEKRSPGDVEAGYTQLSKSPEVVKVEMEEAVKQEPCRSKALIKSQPAISTKAYMKLKKEKVLQYQRYSQERGGSTVYRCPHCKFETKFVGFFGRHLGKCHNEEGQWICNECSAIFTKKATWKKHMNKHAKRFMCDKCSYRCSDSRDLKQHVWTHTGDYPFKCSRCDYQSRFRKALVEHQRKHSGELLKCEVEGCEFGTFYKWSLASHQAAKHKDQKRFICSKCGYRTSDRGSFTKHTKLHEGAKDFKCTMCQYRGMTRHDIVRHMRSHTKEKVYFCDQCDFSSSYSSGLKSHMMQHYGVKPWQCSVCGYNSIMKSKVARHLKQKHPDKDVNSSIINLGLKLKINPKNFRHKGEVAPEAESEYQVIYRDQEIAELLYTQDETAQVTVQEETVAESELANPQQVVAAAPQLIQALESLGHSGKANSAATGTGVGTYALQIENSPSVVDSSDEPQQATQTVLVQQQQVMGQNHIIAVLQTVSLP